MTCTKKNRCRRQAKDDHSSEVDMEQTTKCVQKRASNRDQEWASSGSETGTTYMLDGRLHGDGKNRWAIHPSREELLVIPTEKVSSRMEEAGEQMERQRHRLGQWLTQEQETEARLNEQQQREEWLGVKSANMKQDIIHAATVQKAQAATRKANQERWSRIKNVCEQRDCDQKNAGKMTVVTTAMDTYVARRKG